MAQKGDVPNRKGLSDMFWLWGQFIDHDIDLSLTDRSKPADIPLPANETVFTNPIQFFRSKTNGTEQLNDITPYIDGSNIYGSSKELEKKLRTGKDGKFILIDNYLPLDDIGMYLSGDIRVNENIALTSMHTIWVREHNHVAENLAQMPYKWTDEKLFSAARRIVVAEMQAITFNEFLPLLLGSDTISPYEGYDKNTSPQIMSVFSTAAYRFGHTMLSSKLWRIDENDQVIPDGHLPLKYAFFNPALMYKYGIDSLFRGMSASTAQAVDPLLVDDIRNLLFKNIHDGNNEEGFDLASLNIQRGRDHQLPSYNAVRNDLGLSTIKNFSSDKFKTGYGIKLQAAYDNPDQIDLWVGGLLEKHEGDSYLVQLLQVLSNFSLKISVMEIHRGMKIIIFPMMNSTI